MRPVRLYRDRRFEIPNSSPVSLELIRHDQAMGSWLSDVLGINIDLTQGIENILNAIGQAIHAIGQAIANINWSQLINNIALAVRTIANVAYQIFPPYAIIQGLRTNPITAPAFATLNNFLGGLLTTVVNIDTLPFRVAAGQPISTQELVSDALLAVRVITVVLTGGAAAVVSAEVTGQLDQGTLGQTAVGQGVAALLGVATGVGLAGGIISKAVTTTVENQTVAAGEQVAVKDTSLGQTALGQIAIAAAGSVAGGELQGATGSAIASSAGQTAAVTAGSKAGGAAGSLAAGLLYGNASSVGAAIVNAPSAIASVITNAPSSIANAIVNSPGAIADALVNAPGALVGLIVQGATQAPAAVAAIPGAIAQAVSNIQAPTLGTPTIGNPSAGTPQINIGQIPNVTLPNGTIHHVVSRTQTNPFFYTDTLDDGSQVMDPDWPDILLGLIALSAGIYIAKRASA